MALVNDLGHAKESLALLLALVSLRDGVEKVPSGGRRSARHSLAVQDLCVEQRCADGHTPCLWELEELQVALQELPSVKSFVGNGFQGVVQYHRSGMVCRCEHPKSWHPQARSLRVSEKCLGLKSEAACRLRAQLHGRGKHFVVQPPRFFGLLPVGPKLLLSRGLLARPTAGCS